MASFWTPKRNVWFKHNDDKKLGKKPWKLESLGGDNLGSFKTKKDALKYYAGAEHKVQKGAEPGRYVITEYDDDEVRTDILTKEKK